MVMSVMPMRCVTAECWLSRGKSRSADCAWQNEPPNDRTTIAVRETSTCLDIEHPSSCDFGFGLVFELSSISGLDGRILDHALHVPLKLFVQSLVVVCELQA